MGLAPEVDVIIPVGGTTKYLHPAIVSARSQAGVRTNLIVVDARGSGGGHPLDIPDDAALVESPVRLFAGAARNAGFDHGSAKLVSFLDADDLWPPSRTGALVRALGDSQTAMSVGKLDILREEQGTETLVGPPVGSPALFAGGVLLSRQLAEEIGPFDEELRAGEFVDWMARAQALGVETVEVDTISRIRRIHRESSSVADADSRKDFLKVVKKWMNNKP